MKFGLLLYNAYRAASAVLLVDLPIGNCYSTQNAKTKTKGPYANERIMKSIRFRGLDEDDVPDSDYLIQLGDEFVDNFDSVALSDDGFTVAFGDSSYNITQVFQYNIASDEWIQLGNDIIETETGTAVALSADGSILASAGPWYSISGFFSGTVEGRVQIFQYSSSNNDWIQVGSDITGDEDQDYEECGSSVALNAAGDIVAFGCPGYDGTDNNVGRIRVFQFLNGDWYQLGNDLLGEQSDEYCGDAADLSGSGDVVTFSCRYDADGSDKGRARVFQFSNGAWFQIGSDIIGEDDGDQFGRYGISISSAGDILASGSPINSGFEDVRVFQLSNGAWSQVGSSIFPDIEGFGNSLALSSDSTTLIAGSSVEGEALVYTYSDSDNNWIKRGQKLSVKTGKSATEARDVAISADGMIVSTIYGGGAKVYTFPTPSSSPSITMTVGPSAGPSVSVSAQPSVAGDLPGEISLIPTLSPISSESCCCCEKSGLAKLLFDTLSSN